MKFIVNFFVNWVIQKKLLDMFRNLKGYTTYLGVLLTSFQTFLIAYKPEGTVAEAGQAVVDGLVHVGTVSPLTSDEIGMLATSAVIVVGLIRKLYDSLKPKTPEMAASH